ncbi:sulfotransferase domain-containing protein [Salinibacter sp.]|uniref:sulfotransferase domain-containing protein n=1 Tax=Salinibacter sp. TaxID=2065818 RepID=UPI0021E8F54D|nr:sulfotransferase domain-containing protein [Salinibacter sp.]
MVKSDKSGGMPPTFIHIGGQRCGTSWMFNCISEHPQVYTPEKKEIHYFDKKIEKSKDWYLQHFRPSKNHDAWGECTPEYLSWNEGNISVPKKVKEISPKCRIICCLRNPIERAYSQWEYWPGKKESFEKSIKNNYNNMLKKGLYARHLKRWLKYFDRKEILVQIHDEVLKDNKNAVKEVYSHIGVGEEFEPSWVGKNYNSVVMPGIQSFLKNMGMRYIIEIVKKSGMEKFIRRKVHEAKKYGKNEKIDKRLKDKLKKYYRKPNKELSKILEKDMDFWNEI